MEAALWALAAVFATALAAGVTQALRWQSGLQNTVDALRKRLDSKDSEHLECEKERAALRQRLDDLENRHGRKKDGQGGGPAAQGGRHGDGP